MSASAPRNAADMAFKSLGRALVEMAGGLDAAAAATRVGRSQLAAYQSPQHEQYMPVDVAARLEQLSGEPLITAELARRAGYTLVPLHALGEGEMAALLARLGTEVGEVFAAYAEALRDGRMDRAEMERLGRELQDLMRAAGNADMHLRGLLNAGAGA